MEADQADRRELRDRQAQSRPHRRESAVGSGRAAEGQGAVREGRTEPLRARGRPVRHDPDQIRPAGTRRRHRPLLPDAGEHGQVRRAHPLLQLHGRHRLVPHRHRGAHARRRLRQRVQARGRQGRAAHRARRGHLGADLGRLDLLLQPRPAGRREGRRGHEPPSRRSAAAQPARHRPHPVQRRLLPPRAGVRAVAQQQDHLLPVELHADGRGHPEADHGVRQPHRVRPLPRRPRHRRGLRRDLPRRRPARHAGAAAHLPPGRLRRPDPPGSRARRWATSR